MSSADIRLSRRAKHSGKLRWFLTGFISVLLACGIFFAGFEVGQGNWQIGFGVRTVNSNKSLPNELDYSTVNEVYQALKLSYDGELKLEDLMAGLKKGLVEASGDPYTAYLSSDEAKDFNEQLNGSFSGIGAELGKKGTDIVVIAPINGFPAEKAGLKAKDIIISIDDQDAAGLSVEEAVTRIRGEKGTTVKLAVIRNDSERIELSIIREIITIPSVEYKIIEDSIGYIQISRFSEDTAKLTRQAAQEFTDKNVIGVILDLRNNPGGYLNTAVDVSGLWLKKDQIILLEKRDGKVTQTFKAETAGQLSNIKTVVLINEGSASASEITAGALKDNNAATIVGVTSFGKGSVQEFNSFSGGDVLKVTVARWYTPGGKNIDKEGIKPDIKQELSEEDIKAGLDSQLQKAKSLLKL